MRNLAHYQGWLISGVPDLSVVLPMTKVGQRDETRLAAQLPFIYSLRLYLFKMSSQADRGIPFSIADSQQNVRLFELPPALLELLSAPNPPSFASPLSPPPNFLKH